MEDWAEISTRHLHQHQGFKSYTQPVSYFYIFKCMDLAQKEKV